MLSNVLERLIQKNRFCLPQFPNLLHCLFKMGPCRKKTSRFSRPANDSKTGSVPLLSAPTVESGEQSLQNRFPRSSEKVAADAIQKQTPPSASATLSPDVSREEPTVSVLTSSQTVPVNPLDAPQEQVSDLEESPYPAEPTLSAEDSDSLIAPEFKPDIKNSSTLALWISLLSMQRQAVDGLGWSLMNEL